MRNKIPFVLGFLIHQQYIVHVTTLDTALQQKCRTFLSRTDALTFLSSGQRATPKRCCEEGGCEVIRKGCLTEQFRTFIKENKKHDWHCPSGQVVAIREPWCWDNMHYKCTDICNALGNPRCENGGTCRSNGSAWHCECNHGYTGVICATDIDECKLSNPCNSFNTARCENTFGSFICHCKPGFTGDDCQSEIDECNSGPCKNSGTCIDRVNGFECSCIPGYTGPLCETDINECDSNPCQNGATCKDHVNFFLCECSPGFYGTLCDTNICRPLPADVVFVLDSSVSMTESQFKKQLEFVSNFTDEIRLGHRDLQISVITYSFDAHIEFYLDQYTDNATLKEAVANITYKPGTTMTHLALEAYTDKVTLTEAPANITYKPGTTMTHLALSAVKTVFSPGHGGDVPRYNNTQASRFVYLLTDGLSNDRSRTKTVAKELKHDLGVTISAIGIGHQVSHQELFDVSSKRYESGKTVAGVYSVKNFNSLYTVLKQLVHYTCQECIHSKKSDVSLAMDVSYSMTERQLDMAKGALTYVIDRLDLGENETKISLTTFSSSVNRIFDLDAYNTTSSLLARVNSVRRSKETSKVDMAEVLNELGRNLLASRRPDARSFIIMTGNGKFSVNDKLQLNEAKKALDNTGVETIVIGTGSDVSITQLESLTTDPYNVYLTSVDVPVGNLEAMQSYFVYNDCDLE